MYLSGWIGPKKARERHVFTLQAMKLCRLNPKEQNRHRRLRWPAHSGVRNNSGKSFTEATEA
jgi:hypothetical protein